MKLVGFIREYNDLSESKKLSELLESKSLYTTDIEKIINYLDQGVLLLGWMGYFIDFETKELIAPDSYFTDGIWVWPSYLSYYLKKHPMLMVDEDFVKHIEKKGFQFSVEENFNTQKVSLERELATKLNG